MRKWAYTFGIAAGISFPMGSWLAPVYGLIAIALYAQWSIEN